MTNEVDELSLSLAKEVVEQIAPQDVAIFDEIATAESSDYGSPGKVGLGIGLEALAGSFVVMILPEIRKFVKTCVADGLLFFEVKIKKWLLSGADADASKRALTQDTVKKLVKEARQNVLKNGFTKEQADALELVLLRRLLG